jgi:hypothetical protein
MVLEMEYEDERKKLFIVRVVAYEKWFVESTSKEDAKLDIELNRPNVCLLTRRQINEVRNATSLEEWEWKEAISSWEKTTYKMEKERR